MNITEAIDGYSGHEHTLPTFPLQDDVIKFFAPERHRVHADDHRRLRRTVGRELLVRARGRARRREAASLHCRLGDSMRRRCRRKGGGDNAGWFAPSEQYHEVS